MASPPPLPSPVKGEGIMPLHPNGFPVKGEGIMALHPNAFPVKGEGIMPQLVMPAPDLCSWKGLVSPKRHQTFFSDVL